MTGSTHVAAGAAIGALAGALAGQPVTGAVIGGIAGLVADIDHPGSRLGRKVRSLAVLLEEKWGHRESPAHTLFFLAPVGFALGLVAGIVAGYAVVLTLAGVLGAVSHLVLDAMTRSGVRPFRVWLPKPVLPEWFPAKAQKLVERWADWVNQVEEKTNRYHYKGKVVTGQDWREHVIAAAGWLIVVLIITVSK